MGSFHITRVVSRDVVRDFFNYWRNFFGFRLRNWEAKLNKNMAEMVTEMQTKYNVDWYRMIVNPLTDGSAMIIIYGEGDRHGKK